MQQLNPNMLKMFMKMNIHLFGDLIGIIIDGVLHVCHSLLRQSYCTGTIVEEKEIEFATTNPTDESNSDRAKSLVELHREKLNKQKIQPKSSTTDDKNSIMKKIR